VRPCALSPSKLLGMPGLTLEGCDVFRGVVTGGGEAGGGGARCSLASRALNAASSSLSILLVTWVASAWSLHQDNHTWCAYFMDKPVKPLKLLIFHLES
jgi:hypothetical protein